MRQGVHCIYKGLTGSDKQQVEKEVRRVSTTENNDMQIDVVPTEVAEKGNPSGEGHTLHTQCLSINA